MDNTISILDIEKMLASRPSYDITADCPFTEEIALAVEAGRSVKDISAQYPHIDQCALCTESIQLYAKIDEDEFEGNPDEQTDPNAMYTVPLPPPAVRVKKALLAIAAIVLIGAAGSIGMYLWQAGHNQTTGTTLTPKGTMFDMEIAVNRNGTGFPLEQGKMVETGDKLGFFYSATQNAYLALFHVDEQRELSPLFPLAQTHTPQVKRGTRVPIEDGARVTPASSCEWIVAVFSQKTMSISRLQSYLKKRINISKVSGTCRMQISEKNDMTIKVQQIRK